MAQKVLIMGESGTGKSTSLRNCDPVTTAVINPVGKPLPFKNHFEMLNNETDARKIVKYMKEQCEAGKKLLVVDDFQYILAVPYMNRIKETGWDKYNDFGANYFEIIDCCKDLPDDVVVVYMTHLETLDNGLTTVKLIGKLLREKITIEGLFTVVLRTGVNEAKYYFYTQNSGKDTVKSPLGMFTAYAMKKKQVAAAKAGRKAEAKQWKKAQLPYKKMLNALSGAMKDNTNAAYDPRNNNCMCINGQLMLLDLIEHLEVVPGLELIQSNTDGLIIWIPDTDEAFEMVDDICWEWEQRCSTEQCSILLELDNISEIYQKDVNNYLWIGTDGGVERIGAYVKELSAIDNDLPILNKALVDYMVKKIPVEQTIDQCDDLIMFQKIVKLSNNYNWVEHEQGTGHITKVTKHRDGTRTEVWSYPTAQKYTYKSYRVFASNRVTDGRLLRRKVVKPKGEKFGNTPDHSFIYNDSVVGVKVPPELDKQWYIDLARKRLKQFGIVA